MLTNQLTENDRVAMVVYAGNSGLVLPSTVGTNKSVILDAIDPLQAGGSTNGAGGIQLAYDTAVAGFIKGGANRLVLATDGDFNVGISDLTIGAADRRESQERRVFNHTGLWHGQPEGLHAGATGHKGNGNYAYIDGEKEAKKVLVDRCWAHWSRLPRT